MVSNAADKSRSTKTDNLPSSIAKKKVIENFKNGSFSTVTRAIGRLETTEKIVPIQMGY